LCAIIRRPSTAGRWSRVTHNALKATTMIHDRKIIIIAGPNGAGKTTFAEEFLPKEAHCPMFVNADLIAAGLSPFTPEGAAFRAGRLMLAEISEHVRRKASFAFETTLSGRGYVRRIRLWREGGYRVKLFFLRLDSPDLAVARVRQRVKAGGHNVPEDVVRRRFASGLSNFERVYKAVVDEWALYDNSSRTPILIEEGTGT
jgi:predicted ABC-type ATPase